MHTLESPDFAANARGYERLRKLHSQAAIDFAIKIAEMEDRKKFYQEINKNLKEGLKEIAISVAADQTEALESGLTAIVDSINALYHNKGEKS